MLLLVRGVRFVEWAAREVVLLEAVRFAAVRFVVVRFALERAVVRPAGFEAVRVGARLAFRVGLLRDREAELVAARGEVFRALVRLTAVRLAAERLALVRGVVLEAARLVLA